MTKTLKVALLLSVYAAAMATYTAVKDGGRNTGRLEVYRNIPDAEGKQLVAANPSACEHRPDLKLVTCQYR